MRRRPVRPLALLVAVAALVSTLGAPAFAGTQVAADDWLGTVNAYRATAGLRPVVANEQWTSGARAHSRYMVMNGDITHEEDPRKPGYTAAGDEAGRSGNVMATSGTGLTARYAIDLWMQGPFHAAGLLDPRLRATAYAQHIDPSASKWRSAATMDTIRGLDRSVGGITTPVVWPGDRSGVPQGAYKGGEWPDPLTPCRGYTVPSGLPIVILGAGTLTAHSLTADGAPLEHCAYDAGGYRNPDAATQEYARRGMASRGAAFIVPRAPLTVGTTYVVSATADGRTLRWSFTVTDGGFVPAGQLGTTTTPKATPQRQPRVVPAELATACPESMPEGGFADVADASVHRAAIDCVAWWKVSTGASAGRYAPSRSVTRGQMASFLDRTLRAAGVELVEGPDRFVDDDGSPHERPINALTNAGVVGGTPVGLYRPDAAVTRAQMATMLTRAVALVEGRELPEGRDRFSDDDGSPHEAAINRAANVGLASGVGAGRFAPGAEVGRDQMATFVARTLNRLTTEGFASRPA